MVYLGADVLGRLKGYGGYESCVGESVTTPYLRPIWQSFAKKLGTLKPAVPLLLTFGLLLAASAILMRAVCHGEKPPNWMYMFCGVTGVMYQANSAAESERAREDKSPTSALDVIFWQGLNTYAAGTFVLNAIMALDLDARWVFLALVLGYTTSYTVHWQKYVSGRRRLVSSHFDVSEIQLALSAILIVTAVAGADIWRMPVPMLEGWALNDVLLYFLAFRAGLTCMRYGIIIQEGGPGEEGMTAAETAVLSPGPPLTLALLVSRHLYWTSTFDDVPYTTIVGVGILFAKITNKLMIAEVSKSPLEQIDVLFWPIFALAGLEFFGIDFNHTIVTDSYVGFAIINLAMYSYHVLVEISDHLGGRIFTSAAPATEPKKKPKAQ